jgi:hypothetical protein
MPTMYVIAIIILILIIIIAFLTREKTEPLIPCNCNNKQSAFFNPYFLPTVALVPTSNADFTSRSLPDHEPFEY